MSARRHPLRPERSPTAPNGEREAGPVSLSRASRQSPIPRVRAIQGRQGKEAAGSGSTSLFARGRWQCRHLASACVTHIAPSSVVPSSSSTTMPPWASSPPTPRGHFLSSGNEDQLVSALHAAFSMQERHVPGHGHIHVPQSALPDVDAPTGHPTKDKSMSIEIAVVSDTLYLKGTGSEVEPAVLSGHVILHLAEPTSFKEITLQFRGKAKLPVTGAESISGFNSSPAVYSICSHDWSFLEGPKKHSHTLKAGKHMFSFELHVGGALPSSITTATHGGASISYKLVATAVRPGIVSSNLTASTPIALIRSFSSEALEYQQTLEIENTWPNKIMYSLMLPHKAWAAGDTLVVIAKFAALSKGVSIQSIATFINETTKTYTKMGHLENTRSVVHMKHQIVDGAAVPVPLDARSKSARSSEPTTPVTTTHHSFPNTPAASDSLSPRQSPRQSTDAIGSTGSSRRSSFENLASSSRQSIESSAQFEAQGGDDYTGDSEVTLRLLIPLPKKLLPTHPLEPISVTHRIRWSIHITNLDGHTSELRCSLPIHILHERILDEARAATLATRRLILGEPADEASAQETELPSYPAHFRDRIATAYLPDSATMRVPNPWVPGRPEIISIPPTPGPSSPLFDGSVQHSNNSDPPSGQRTPLELVNSELLLANAEPQPDDGQPDSRERSGRNSARMSRASSRATSPEPRASMAIARAHSESHDDDRAHHSDHSHNHHRRGHGVFSVVLRPLSSIYPPWSQNTSRSQSPTLEGVEVQQSEHHPVGQSHSTRSNHTQHQPHGSESDSNRHMSVLLQRALSELPDYSVSSRGFIGGGAPPLDSLRSLPSYDEVGPNAPGSSRGHTIAQPRSQRPLQAASR